jgi:DDE_Tnp_1-associated
VPTELSSAIPAALTQLAHANSLQETEAPHLLAYLATISDPRGRRGRRHPLVAILAMAAAAVLGGARSMAAIAEWAADAPELIRVALGARRDGPAHCVVPSEATIRRTLARLDAETLAEVIGFQPLLADLDLAGAVVTADALHAHAGAAKFLVTTKRADHLFTVKANQPTLLNRCARLAWRQVPVLDPHPPPRPRPGGDPHPEGGHDARVGLATRLSGPSGDPARPATCTVDDGGP